MSLNYFFPFPTSLNSLVNVLMISAFCMVSNISLLTTPGQTNETVMQCPILEIQAK